MEKERLEKVQRLFELYSRNKVFADLYRRYEKQRGFPPYCDFISLWEAEGDEYWKLYRDLYPEPPKDLMEDVKKRMEAYKSVKRGTGNRIPPLSLKQKFELLFKREGNENAK